MQFDFEKALFARRETTKSMLLAVEIYSHEGRVRLSDEAPNSCARTSRESTTGWMDPTMWLAVDLRYPTSRATVGSGCVSETTVSRLLSVSCVRCCRARPAFSSRNRRAGLRRAPHRKLAAHLGLPTAPTLRPPGQRVALCAQGRARPVRSLQLSFETLPCNLNVLSIEPRPALHCHQARPLAGSRPFVIRELPLFRREGSQCRSPAAPGPAAPHVCGAALLK